MVKCKLKVSYLKQVMIKLISPSLFSSMHQWKKQTPRVGIFNARDWCAYLSMAHQELQLVDLQSLQLQQTICVCFPR